MSDKGSRKPNYTATSPPTSRSPRGLHICSHQGFGDHRKRKSQRREQTQRERI